MLNAEKRLQVLFRPTFSLFMDTNIFAALERPMYAEAHRNMGVIYKTPGALELVVACYESLTMYDILL